MTDLPAEGSGEQKPVVKRKLKRRGVNKLVRFPNPDLLVAMNEVAPRLSMTTDNLIEHACKAYMRGLGITWWQSAFEVNTPEEPGPNDK